MAHGRLFLDMTLLRSYGRVNPWPGLKVDGTSRLQKN
jgi:hypothetical protein